MDISLTDGVHYNVSRELYNSKKFNDTHCEVQFSRRNRELKALYKQYCGSRQILDALKEIFPFYSILASFYTFRSFISDFIAGITMSIVHIPQGMAYGYLAGVLPINGLYTSFFPALVYFFFGTSRHVSIGTFSVVAMLTSDPVDRLSAKFSPNSSMESYSNSTEDQINDYRLKIAVTVCILSGLFQVALGIFHLGFLVVYITSPLLSGFTCASAVHVLLSQINGLFGLKLPRSTGPGRFFLVLLYIKFDEKGCDSSRSLSRKR